MAEGGFRPIHPRPRTINQQQMYVDKLNWKIVELNAELERLQRQLRYEQMKLDKLKEQHDEAQTEENHAG